MLDNYVFEVKTYTIQRIVYLGREGHTGWTEDGAKRAARFELFRALAYDLPKDGKPFAMKVSFSETQTEEQARYNALTIVLTIEVER